MYEPPSACRSYNDLLIKCLCHTKLCCNKYTQFYPWLAWKTPYSLKASIEENNHAHGNSFRSDSRSSSRACFRYSHVLRCSCSSPSRQDLSNWLKSRFFLDWPALSASSLFSL